ncbi:MAG: hypothetical protein AAGD35_21165 [Actinomycetota bacterium]
MLDDADLSLLGAPELAGELRAGDLIFVRGPGLVQRLVDWSGDRWRHVGILVSVRGRWWVLEAGKSGYRASPLGTVLDRYSAVVVGRLGRCSNDCSMRLVDAALTLMETPTSYPGTLELGLAGLLSLSRRSRRAHGSLFGALTRSTVQRCRHRLTRGDGPTMCSSLVVRSLVHVCDDHPRFPNLEDVKDRPIGRYRDPIADRMAMPDDIWRLLDAGHRFRLHRDHGLCFIGRDGPELSDLRKGGESRPR